MFIPVDITQPQATLRRNWYFCTYRNHSSLDTKVTKGQNFFSTTSKDERVTNLESDDVFSLVQSLIGPPVYFFLRQVRTAGHFPGNLDLTLDEG
jgi:hypothetical protein